MEVMTMKKAMKTYAEKLMKRSHKAVKLYQQAQSHKKGLTIVQRNMLYGQYLIDMDDAI